MLLRPKAVYDTTPLQHPIPRLHYHEPGITERIHVSRLNTFWLNILLHYLRLSALSMHYYLL